MTHIHFLNRLLSFVLVGTTSFANAQPVHEKLIAHLGIGTQSREVGIISGGSEIAPSGPESIVAARNGSFLLLDSVNSRVLRVNADGTIIEAARDPRLAYAQDMIRRQNIVYALGSQPFELGQDTGSGALMKEATESTPSANTTRLFESNGAVLQNANEDAEESSPRMVQWLLTSDDSGEHEYRVIRNGNEKIQAIEIRSQSTQTIRRLLLPDDSGNLGSVALLAIDADRRAYLRVETLQQHFGQAQAKVWVIRYSAENQIEAGFDIPDNQMDMVPNRYLAVNDNGALVFMQPTNRGVNLLQVLAVPSQIFLVAYRESLSNAPTQRPKRESEIAAHESTPAAKNRTRAQIMAEAENFRIVAWTLNETNYGEHLVSTCSPANQQYWLRPARLNGKKGAQITGVPYNWGGYMSVAQFSARIVNNAIAGNICTCRGSSACVMGAAAGVDCSGFVSQVWGVPRKTTISLAEISRELKSYNELKQGDILNKRNSHVRLFAAFSASGNGNIRAYESSVGCGGVCVREFTTKQMDGYLPREAPITE